MCSDLVAHLGKYPVEEKQVQKQDCDKDSYYPDEEQSVDYSEELEKRNSIKVVAQAICSDILMEVLMAGGDIGKEAETIAEVESVTMTEELLESKVAIVWAPEDVKLAEDIEHEGVLEQVLGSKFGLVLLQGGEQALLRKKRLWVAGSLPGEWQWEEVKGRKLFCKIRNLKVESQVSYQVSSFKSTV